MTFQYITVEQQDHLTIITINRPEVMNALHVPACRELDRAFDDFAGDADAWAAILTGAGDRAFSTGNDLKWTAEHGPDRLIEGLLQLKGGFGGITTRFDLYKPVIAAVNGRALGGGFEMALACDLIIAAEDAVFGLPEPKVGLAAGAGGVQRLLQKMPYNRAMEYILTGRTMTAEEAKSHGLVNEVVPARRVLEAAGELAADILACSPLAVRASKEGALLAAEKPLSEVAGRPYPGIETLMRSEDVIEGAAAFAEKRRPRWKGR